MPLARELAAQVCELGDLCGEAVVCGDCWREREERPIETVHVVGELL